MYEAAVSFPKPWQSKRSAGYPCRVPCLQPALLCASLHSFHFFFYLHTPFEFQVSCLCPLPSSIPCWPVSWGCLPSPWTNSGKLSNQEWILTISKVLGNWMRPMACAYCHTRSHHSSCLGLPRLAGGHSLASRQLLEDSSASRHPHHNHLHPLGA